MHPVLSRVHPFFGSVRLLVVLFFLVLALALVLALYVYVSFVFFVLHYSFVASFLLLHACPLRGVAIFG